MASSVTQRFWPEILCFEHLSLRRVMTAIAMLWDYPLKKTAYLLFKSRNNLDERVSVIGISRKGCDMSIELSAF